MKNLKSKLENFWYYHKTATILTIIFVFAAVQLFTFRNDYVPQDGKIALITSGYVCDEQVNLNDLVKDKIVDVNEDGMHSLNVAEFIITGKLSDDAMVEQQILSSFSTGDTGLYIFDKVNLDRFMVYDAFMPLDNLLSEDILASRAAYTKDGQVYAVSLKDCGLIDKFGFTFDDLYAAVIFDRPADDIDAETMQLAENSKVLLTELLK